MVHLVLTNDMEGALEAVGELLAVDGHREAVVVVGGASLLLLGIVDRATQDVDVVARASVHPGDPRTLIPARPFPAALSRAIETVARDFELAPDWMNAAVGAQWTQGFPPGMDQDLHWRNYGGGLDVGLVGRRSLIAFKLFAAADQSPGSVHTQDLLALDPTPEELEAAAAWVLTQDLAPSWNSLILRVVAHVTQNRR